MLIEAEDCGDIVCVGGNRRSVFVSDCVCLEAHSIHLTKPQSLEALCTLYCLESLLSKRTYIIKHAMI